jgi:hypothetical protein
MRGLETMPFVVLLAVFLTSIAVVIGFWQTGYFLGFKNEADFKQDIVGFYQQLRTLQATGDWAAFTSAQVTVPSGYNFTIDLDNDLLIGQLKGTNFTINTTVNMTAFRDSATYYNKGQATLGPGKYSLRLYYGELQENETRSYTIVFK